MSTEINTDLFNKCVSLIRRGTSYVDLQIELEQAALPGTDIRDVINKAQKYVSEMQAESFSACVEFFKRGGSYLDAVRKLTELKFHPYDSEQLAARAKAKADAEVAEESLADGLSALGKSE